MEEFLKKVVILILFSKLSLGAGNIGQQYYRIKIQNDNDARFQLKMLKFENELGLTVDRVAKHMNKSLIFRAPESKSELIKELLKLYNVQRIQCEPYQDCPPTFPKLQRMFFDETEPNYEDFKVDLNDFNFNMVAERYLCSYEIDLYTDYVAKMIKETNSNIEVKVTHEGSSYEGRPIKSLTVGYKNKNNPIVFIDAGIHAREWHSRSLALYIMKQLIHEAELDTNGLIYTTTIIIVANVNPDGYEFSLNEDHMWRKTRRPVTPECVGVDGNRNFDVYWNVGEREKMPCMEVYRGEKPFSEVETQIIRDIMERIKEECFLYISIHTFGNSILYPYGYTEESHPNRVLLHRIAAAGVDAVEQKTGSVFIADQSGSNLYIAAGGSDDYAIDAMGIRFTYTFELGPEHLGFALPNSQIAQSVDEGWTAIEAMINEAKEIIEMEEN